MRTCYLYHIRHESDSGNLKEGYIGITYNPEKRFKQHSNPSTSCNIYLLSKIQHNSDVTVEVISEGSRSEMARLERYLRPTKMGWNLVEGGGDPPNLKGHKWSKETQSKRLESLRVFYESNGGANVTDKVKEAQRKSGLRDFILISPEGEKIEGEHLGEFCKENGFSKAGFHRMLVLDRKQNGGWTGCYKDLYEDWIKLPKRTSKPKVMF